MHGVDKMKILYIATPLLALIIMATMILFVTNMDERPPNHCQDCPSESCICILGKRADAEKEEWMLSPEVGDTEFEECQNCTIEN